MSTTASALLLPIVSVGKIFSRLHQNNLPLEHSFMGDTALSILSGENFEILCIQHNCSHGAAYGMEQGLGVGGVLFSDRKSVV